MKIIKYIVGMTYSVLNPTFFLRLLKVNRYGKKMLFKFEIKLLKWWFSDYYNEEKDIVTPPKKTHEIVINFTMNDINDMVSEARKETEHFATWNYEFDGKQIDVKITIGDD